jgi:hypothetical protein
MDIHFKETRAFLAHLEEFEEDMQLRVLVKLSLRFTLMQTMICEENLPTTTENSSLVNYVHQPDAFSATCS